jgi:hypothetical protein
MKKEKLHDRVYINKKTGNAYPLTEDGSAIDHDNPIRTFETKKYKLAGSNNVFDIYELRVTQYK